MPCCSGSQLTRLCDLFIESPWQHNMCSRLIKYQQSSLLQEMAWNHTGVKPFLETMTTKTSYCKNRLANRPDIVPTTAVVVTFGGYNYAN